MMEDPEFRLKRNLSRAAARVITSRTSSRGQTMIQHLGCTGEELVKHLESLFQPMMSWNNYGNKPGQWSLDHIMPLSAFDFTNEQHILLACHYLNLRPMWHIWNVKKSDQCPFSGQRLGKPRLGPHKRHDVEHNDAPRRTQARQTLAHA